jgi:hypothetical protein
MSNGKAFDGKSVGDFFEKAPGLVLHAGIIMPVERKGCPGGWTPDIEVEHEFQRPKAITTQPSAAMAASK